MIIGHVLKAEESKEGYRNIAIVIEFIEDGVVIVPEWILWARFENFLGMKSEEIAEWIRINIEHQIGNIIKERVKTDLNIEFMQAIESLKDVKVFQTDMVVIPIEKSAVISEAYNVIIKADGSVTTDRVEGVKQ